MTFPSQRPCRLGVRTLWKPEEVRKSIHPTDLFEQRVSTALPFLKANNPNDLKEAISAVKHAAFWICALLAGTLLSSCQSSSAPSQGGVAPDSGWFIEPAQTTAAQRFTLQLLNDAYDSCKTLFTHTSLTVDQNSIYASFVAESRPDSVCATDVRPYGPSYPVTSLAEGKYAVYGSSQAACEYTDPMCDIVSAPFFVESLSVILPPSGFLETGFAVAAFSSR